MGQIRRALSCIFIRAQALCLLARLGQVGTGARSAADRRVAALQAEVYRKREAEAHLEAHIRSRGLGRKGMIFIP